jgi:hypothetical protein
MTLFTPLTRRRCLPAGALRAALCGALLAASPSGYGQDVGRVFFTPQQRQDLDRRRDTNVPETGAPVESLVTVNGHVTRSSGKTTTWINGVPQYDTYRGRVPDRVAVESGTTMQGVRVGQTLDRSSGEVRDVLPGGAIKVDPAPR